MTRRKKQSVPVGSPAKEGQSHGGKPRSPTPTLPDQQIQQISDELVAHGIRDLPKRLADVAVAVEQRVGPRPVRPPQRHEKLDTDGNSSDVPKFLAKLERVANGTTEPR